MVVSITVGFQLFAAKRYCEQLNPGTQVWGYEDIALVAFGPIGKIIVLLTLIVLLVLTLIAYMIFTRDQLDLIVQFALTKTGHIPTCSPLMNCAVLVSMAFIPIFPVTLLRVLTPMQITSTFSMMCITYVGITMFIKMVIYQHSHGPVNRASIVPEDPRGLLITVSYCSLSFVCHFNLLPLQKELHRPTKRRMSIIVVFSMLLAYTLYNLVIFSGVFRFFGDLQEDVMLNYPRTDVLMTTARVALFFTLLCSYPVLLHPTRGAINRLIVYSYQLLTGGCRRREGRQGRKVAHTKELEKHFEAEEEVRVKGEEKVPLLQQQKTKSSSDVEIPLPVWISETWILFASTFICASYISNVGLVWNFVGSIGGTLILYIFPPAFFLRLRYMRYTHRSRTEGLSVRSQYNWSGVVREGVAAVIMVTGLLLLVAENYSAFEAILTQSHAPTGLCYQSKCSSFSNSSYFG
jgi:amino acid permease